MRSDTLAIRDRLLAVLRDADRALTTNEVCDLAGPYRQVEPCAVAQGWRHHGPDHPYVHTVACDGEHDVVEVSLAVFQRGYNQLRALEAMGLTRRTRVAGHREAYWTAVASRVEVEVAELEAIWSAS